MGSTKDNCHRQVGWDYRRKDTEDPTKCVSQVHRYQFESTDTGQDRLDREGTEVKDGMYLEK